MRATASVVALAALVALPTGCSTVPSAPAPALSSSATKSTSKSTTVEIRKVLPFPGIGRFDDQIGGPHAPASDVAVVDRDRHEQPVAGRFNVT